MSKNKKDKTDILIEKNSKPYIDFNLHPEYYSIDFYEYFDELKQKGKIKKNTFTTLYHPMSLLIGEYKNLLEKTGEKVNINNSHILLLCYFIGFTGGDIAHKTCVYWGSNRNLANDLGVSTRTIQRWIGDLLKTGFISVIIQFKTERYIYINYGLIIKRINDILNVSKKKITIPTYIKAAKAYFEQRGYIHLLNEKECIDYLCEQEELREISKEKMDFETCLLLLSEKLKINIDKHRTEFDKAINAYEYHYKKEKN